MQLIQKKNSIRNEKKTFTYETIHRLVVISDSSSLRKIISTTTGECLSGGLLRKLLATQM